MVGLLQRRGCSVKPLVVGGTLSTLWVGLWGRTPSNGPFQGHWGRQKASPLLGVWSFWVGRGVMGGPVSGFSVTKPPPPPSTSTPGSEAVPRAKRLTSEQKLEARLEELGSLLRELVRECRDLKATVASGRSPREGWPPLPMGSLKDARWRRQP